MRSAIQIRKMHLIKSAEFIGPNIKKFIIDAPKISLKRKAGQFVIIRLKEEGERIPLTIADADPAEGTITIIVQGIGRTTKELNTLKAGEFIQDVVGPLGKPSHIEKFGTAVSIGGGVGTAIAYPTAKALKAAGNYTISIIGGRTKEHVIMEDEMNQVCDEVYPATDDGSYGFKGFVTQKLLDLINAKRKIDFVLAIGPVPMMKAVAETTRPFKIPTVISLNPIMVDGTGMCGGCRATVDNKTVFVCVDGPEFDAHKVDFDTLMKRNQTYREEETAADHLCNYDKLFCEEIKSKK
ncbi:MAG: sulfide/dihydroorotate dehydrogenase-like FAD/NAD-binding protein [Ignavibacteriaceae bacterium]